MLPTAEQVKLQQFIAQVRPLFATQSQPCAELMLAAIKTKRLKLIAGEFLLTRSTPTILQTDGRQIHPNCSILATGFEPPISATYPQANPIRCYQVSGTSLSSVHQRAANVARDIVTSLQEQRKQPLASCMTK